MQVYAFNTDGGCTNCPAEVDHVYLVGETKKQATSRHQNGGGLCASCLLDIFEGEEYIVTPPAQ